ncbi:MAG: hypothetical protein PHY29_06210 [Syntrophales bacterium]|nr:hypothetical protein [Syntrophales bacterium]
MLEHASILNWQKDIESGQKYLKTAWNGQARPTVFTPELTYQVTAMAIEKLLVGLSRYHNQMSMDHILEGLVDGLALICPIATDQGDGIKALGRFDNMCSLEPANRHIPTGGEVQWMLALARKVETFAMERVKMPGDQKK